MHLHQTGRIDLIQLTVTPAPDKNAIVVVGTAVYVDYGFTEEFTFDISI